MVQASKIRYELNFISINRRVLSRDKRNLYLSPDIIKVIKEGNIVALLETWLSKPNLNRIDSLHDDFIGHGVANIMF